MLSTAVSTVEHAPYVVVCNYCTNTLVNKVTFSSVFELWWVSHAFWINPANVSHVVRSFLSPFDHSVQQQRYLLHFILRLCHFFHPLSQREEGCCRRKLKPWVEDTSYWQQENQLVLDVILRPQHWWTKLPHFVKQFYFAYYMYYIYAISEITFLLFIDSLSKEVDLQLFSWCCASAVTFPLHFFQHFFFPPMTHPCCAAWRSWETACKINEVFQKRSL